MEVKEDNKGTLKGLREKKTGIAILMSLLFFELLLISVPIPRHGLFRPSATLVFDRNGKVLRAFTASDEKWRIRTSLKLISPELQKFLIHYEDRWFYFHPGVNPLSLARALYQNLTHGRVVSGGSTLTMQIARMMEPKPRTWYNKLIEMFRALQLERRFSKPELLEIYFNIAPYGGNIEGVAAASWLYFGKEPSQLSYGEAALLAAIPNSPPRLRPDRHPQAAMHARNKVLRSAFKHGLLSEKDYRESLLEKVPQKRQLWPFIAPHMSLELTLRYPGQSRIYSTIDEKLQLLCEDLLKAHVNKLRHEGISNGALVILDNKTHELLAAVGSTDFFSEADQGQVNGVLAPRSPGSALKPFVYALGMENSLISPQHYLEDVPVDFSGYCPENFDRSYSGITSVRDALARSLNVPAIKLLAQLNEKDKGLYSLLRRAGLSTLRSEDHYGLSIVLGGCEVTLLELTTLYSALADGGNYVYPKINRDQAENAPVRLFEPGVAYIITDILTELRRPDLPASWEFTSLPRVAWKTGTSYGHRDAWSIGYNPRYTVGVWIGNFSGEGRSGLVGAEVAAPLLFEVFTKLNADTREKWFKQPPSVDTRQVCALSGKPPGPYCKTLVSELYLPDRSPVQECDFHKVVLLDARTGYRLPPHYTSPGLKTKEFAYVSWPPRVADWMDKSGRLTQRLPPLLPEWHNLMPGQPPVIRSPLADYTYQLREGVAREFQKICLEAAAASDVRKLYWFVDGVLFGAVAPGEKLFYPPLPGTHHLVCQDDQGRSSEMKLVIEE